MPVSFKDSECTSGDFDFTFNPQKDLLCSTPYVLARNAALWCLLPPRRVGVPRPPVEVAYEQVRQAWRKRIMTLHTVGWAAADEPRKIRYLRNCPPVGITTQQKAYTCKRSRVCPWCYAREVVMEAYRATESACFHSITERDRRYWQLVGVRYMLRGAPIENLEAAVLGAQQRRNYDLERLNNPPDSMSWSVLWPDYPAGLGYRRSSLMLWPLDRELPRWLNMEGYEVSVLQPGFDRNRLASLLLWLLAFPRGLLYGDAKLLLRILDCGGRFSSTVGLFRSAGIRLRMLEQRRRVEQKFGNPFKEENHVQDKTEDETQENPGPGGD